MLRMASKTVTKRATVQLSYDKLKIHADDSIIVRIDNLDIS
jgi:hypothetical protein